MLCRALSRASARFALAALLLTLPTLADAAIRVRPWSPLHARLTEIARASGVPLEAVLAEPERWLGETRRTQGMPRVLERPAAAAGIEDQPIRFTFPRRLGGFVDGFRTPVVGDLDGDGDDDIAVFAPATGGLVLYEGGGPRPLSVRHSEPLEPGDTPMILVELDGDGRADLVTARDADGSLGIYRGRGDFSFEPATRVAIGSTPVDVIAAPIGGSSAADLVVQTAGEVKTFLNAGGMTFVPGASVAGAWPYDTRTLVAADFDEDGRTDIAAKSRVVSSGDRYGIRVLRNVADSVLLPMSDVAPMSFMNFGPLSVGDINEDGHRDVLSAEGDSVQVYLGTGTGVLNAAKGVPLGGFEYSSGMHALLAEATGDAHLDLVVLTRLGACFDHQCVRVVLLEGEGDGSFGPPISFMANDPNSSQAILSMRTANLTGGGPHDLVISLGGSAVVLLSDRRGAYLAPVFVDLQWTPYVVRTARLSPAAPPVLVAWDGVDTRLGRGVSVHGVDRFEVLASGEPAAVLDLNRDGLDDLVLARGDTTEIWLADGSGGVARRGSVTGGILLAAGDMDGASGPDLVVADRDGRVLFHGNDGAGSFGPARDLAITVPAGATVMTAGDLDRDGQAEFLIGRDTYLVQDTLAIHWNRGALLEPAVVYPIGMPFDWGGPPENPDLPTSISIGDLDGNGWPDVFVVNGAVADHPGSVSALIQAGSRGFLPAVSQFAGRDPWEGLVADFDRDGLDDAAVTLDQDNWNGALQVYHAGPGGALAPMHESLLGGMTAAHYTRTLATGDWDSDDRTDLVAGNWVSRSLTFYRNLSPPGIPVANAVSLVQAEARPDGVALEWFATGSGFAGAVERARDGGAWTEVARVTADGAGHVAWTDRDVAPGTRVGYRLRWAEGGGVRRTAETWLDVPRKAPLALALHGAQPNPARGAPVLAFTLASTDAATLELFDVSGRRVAARRLDAPAPGRHAVRLGAERALSPGLYLARVTQAGRSAIARVVVGE